jgi:hypothetical protein
MLNDNDRCPACGGKLELAEMDTEGSVRDEDGDRGGTRNG